MPPEAMEVIYTIECQCSLKQPLHGGNIAITWTRQRLGPRGLMGALKAVLYSIQIKGNHEHNNELSLDICLMSACSFKNDPLFFFMKEPMKTKWPKPLKVKFF